ncbi:glycosyltransferase family 2 protein [Zunongwangia atlantica]
MIDSGLVSIIMATYNRSKFIKESLFAIQQQTFSNWECLIIDDGSIDHTESVVNDFIIKDNRFRYLKRSNRYKKGLPGSRNMGIDLSKGKYIIFFDDDDIPHPKNLEICLAHFLPEISYVRYLRSVFYGDFNYNFSENKEYDVSVLNRSVIQDMVIQKIPFNSCQVMWRKKCFEGNKFNESLMFAEEWECYSRILMQKEISGVSLEKVLFYARKHENSNTGEYLSKNKLRLNSKEEACRQVISNLKQNGLFNKTVQKHFLQLAFRIGSFKVLSHTLQKGDYNYLEQIKYLTGFLIYPVLRKLKS